MIISSLFNKNSNTYYIIFKSVEFMFFVFIENVIRKI